MPTRLTDRACLTASRPGLTFDSDAKGLALRINPSGLPSLVFGYREPGTGKQRRILLGHPPALTVREARGLAAGLRLRLKAGEDLQQPERGNTVNALLDEWESVLAVTRRPLTVLGYRKLARRHIRPAFGKLAPDAIDRNGIERWHGRIGTSGIAVDSNRALAVMSAFFSWLVRGGVVELNPCAKVRRFPERRRESFLNDDEIAKAHTFLDKHSNRRAGLALRLALYTGARVGEVIGMQRSEIDLARRLWIKPATRTKQRKHHTLPLAPAAIPLVVEYLDLEPPSYENVRFAVQRLRLALGRPDIRAHDLRHTMASTLARRGATLLQIGAVLGHGSPAMTSRYAHLVASDIRDLVDAAAEPPPAKGRRR